MNDRFIPTTIAAAEASTASLTGGPNDLMEYQPFLRKWVAAYSPHRGRQFTRKRIARVTQALAAVAGATVGSGKGNYAGKRPDRVAPPAESPGERFAKLVDAFRSGPVTPDVSPFAPVGHGSHPRPRWPVGHPRRGIGLMRSPLRATRLGVAVSTAAPAA